MILQILGWLSQFIGHGLFESKFPLLIIIFLLLFLERAPAILSNLLFLFIAPFFVIIEVEEMTGLLNKEDMGEVIAKVEEDIANFHGAKTKKEK